ncbi:MAG TPA: response regulator [Methylomirabilota bacterium]
MDIERRAWDGHRLRILVVEDVADIRDVFVLLLQAENAEVVATGSGREAIDAARRSHFDVVLTDLGLPDIAGELVIREILATARQRPRVIVVTGYGEPYVSRAREAGADTILTKPVPWTTVLTAMRHAPSGVVAA